MDLSRNITEYAVMASKSVVSGLIGNFRIASVLSLAYQHCMANQYRHGDVMIEEVDALPAGREKLRHTILAHGEVTGHAHRIKESTHADLYLTPSALYLHVHGVSATVIHEEHRPITLPTGYYRVWRQREYSPEEIRIVRD